MPLLLGLCLLDYCISKTSSDYFVYPRSFPSHLWDYKRLPICCFLFPRYQYYVFPNMTKMNLFSLKDDLLTERLLIFWTYWIILCLYLINFSALRVFYPTICELFPILGCLIPFLERISTINEISFQLSTSTKRRAAAASRVTRARVSTWHTAKRQSRWASSLGLTASTNCCVNSRMRASCRRQWTAASEELENGGERDRCWSGLYRLMSAR